MLDHAAALCSAIFRDDPTGYHARATAFALTAAAEVARAELPDYHRSERVDCRWVASQKRCK
jgi:hypothetical protein